MNPVSRALFALAFSLLFALFVWGGFHYIVAAREPLAGGLIALGAAAMLMLSLYNLKLFLRFQGSRQVWV